MNLNYIRLQDAVGKTVKKTVIEDDRAIIVYTDNTFSYFYTDYDYDGYSQIYDYFSLDNIVKNITRDRWTNKIKLGDEVEIFIEAGLIDREQFLSLSEVKRKITWLQNDEEDREKRELKRLMDKYNVK